MPAPNLKIWSSLKLTGPALEIFEKAVAPHEIVFSRNSSESSLSVAAPDKTLALADIAFGQPGVDCVLQSPRLRWAHLPSAGYGRFDTPEFRAAAAERGLLVTNSSCVYAEPCAEHVFAFMLAQARRLPQALDIQRVDRSWPGLRLRAESRLLQNQSVVILGFGAIAKRLVELLRPFDLQITALRRSPSGAEGIDIVSEETLPRALAGADHVINVLPDTPDTVRFLNLERLAAIKAGAILYNIGRGTTVDQSALLETLHSGHLAAACLDVTDPEPLPPNHPLWTAPNCFITPHTAGGHASEPERLVRHFVANFHRFLSGTPLIDRVM